MQKVEEYNITHSLLLNADETPSKYASTAGYPLAEKKFKSVPIAAIADKRAITATFVKKLNCKFLPMQWIYCGKTSE